MRMACGTVKADAPMRCTSGEPLTQRREILANHPVIVEVQYRALPGRSGSHATDDHFIVVRGADGEDFVYSDPLGFGSDASDVRISEWDLSTAMDAAEAARAGFAVVKPATTSRLS